MQPLVKQVIERIKHTKVKVERIKQIKVALILDAHITHDIIKVRIRRIGVIILKYIELTRVNQHDFSIQTRHIDTKLRVILCIK